MGRPIQTMDALIAATAKVRQLSPALLIDPQHLAALTARELETLTKWSSLAALY